MLKLTREIKAIKTSKKLQLLEAELICLKARKALMKEDEYTIRLMGIEAERTKAAITMLKLAKKLGYDLKEFM